MSRRTTSAAPAASEVPAARIEDLEGALKTVAVMTGSSCKQLQALCTAALATIDGTPQTARTVARVLLEIRDQLDELDNDVGAECESAGCGYVPTRLVDVHARIDAAQRKVGAP